MAAYLNQYKNTNKELPNTHQSLIGGNYRVTIPNGKFLKEYLKLLKGGQKMYLTERVDGFNMFRFFLDIDVDLKYQITSDQIHELIASIQDLIKSTPRISMRGLELSDGTISNICIHKVHLVFYEKPVTKDEALELFQNIISHVYAKFEWLRQLETLMYESSTTQEKQKKWKPRIFDSSVYTSGLRMLGSIKKNDKTSTIPAKLEEKSDPITAKLEEKSDPIPAKLEDKSDPIPKEYREVVFDNDTKSWKGISLSFDSLSHSSIISTQSEFATKKVLPTFLVNFDNVKKLVFSGNDIEPKETATGSKRKELKGKTTEKAAAKKQKTEKEFMLTLSPELESAILENFNISKSKLTQCKYYRDSNSYMIGTTEVFCPNVNQDHTSNHQYFVITKNSITRKCHSSCCLDAKTEIALSDELRKSLFGKDSEDIKPKILQYFKKLFRLQKQQEAIEITITPDNPEQLYIVETNMYYCFNIGDDNTSTQSISVTKEGQAYLFCDDCLQKSDPLDVEQRIMK
ncbi:hypothetical protein HK096_003914 [Nowakowskiella sp. JEL0078]|nr:hypothetical protein HK096_003914 [Nowakowskiella sp. JEL0078]